MDLVLTYSKREQKIWHIPKEKNSTDLFPSDRRMLEGERARGVFGFSLIKEGGLVLTNSHGGDARGEALRDQVACQK